MIFLSPNFKNNDSFHHRFGEQFDQTSPHKYSARKEKVDNTTVTDDQKTVTTIVDDHKTVTKSVGVEG
jgi:hypothetical protein